MNASCCWESTFILASYHARLEILLPGRITLRSSPLYRHNTLVIKRKTDLQLIYKNLIFFSSSSILNVWLGIGLWATAKRLTAPASIFIIIKTKKEIKIGADCQYGFSALILNFLEVLNSSKTLQYCLDASVSSLVESPFSSLVSFRIFFFFSFSSVYKVLQVKITFQMLHKL